MTISELKQQYVFQTLGTGVTVVAIDFQKGAYIDLGNQVVSRIQNMPPYLAVYMWKRIA